MAKFKITIEAPTDLLARVIDAHARQTGWAETIDDGTGQTVQNPLTQRQHIEQDICQMFIRSAVEHARTQKQETMRQELSEMSRAYHSAVSTDHMETRPIEPPERA